MQIKPSLPALAKAVSEVAQSYFRYRQITHLIALCVALLTLFVASFLVYWLLVIAIIAEVLAWWFLYIGEHHHHLSRELTRVGLLSNVFDKEPLDITDLLFSIDNKVQQNAIELDKIYKGEYYDNSDTFDDVTKFLNHLRESAFWSKHLYNKAAQHTFKWLGFIALIVIVILFFVVPVIFDEGATLVPKMTVFFLVFVISDELKTAFAWWKAGIRSDKVDKHLDKIIELKKYSQRDVLALFGDYSVATAEAPPIPSYIFKMERDRLNHLWKLKNQAVLNKVVISPKNLLGL